MRYFVASQSESQSLTIEMLRILKNINYKKYNYINFLLHHCYSYVIIKKKVLNVLQLSNLKKFEA